MTAHNDLDRQLTDFLRDGPDELPYESFDAVRDRTESTRQRVVIGPWRLPEMNKFLTIGLGAAAVVVVVLIGAQLLGTSGGLGGQVEPTPTAEPSSDSSDGGLPVGSPFVWSDGSDGTVPITVTIPAPGWGGELGWFALEKNGDSDAPDDVAVLAFQNGGTAWSVPGDACHVESTMPDTPSATIDELVAAFSAQAPGNASAPVDVVVGGHAGKSITLQVPSDIAFTDGEFTDCDHGMYCLFVDPELDGTLVDTCARPLKGPGQIEELYIVDVNDSLVVIDAASWDGTPEELVEEERAIVGSIEFGD